MTSQTVSKLRSLAKLINDQVDAIESRMASQGLAYPDIDTPVDVGHRGPAEIAALAPEIMGPAMLIVSACGQLTASVNLPAMSIMESANSFHLSSCLKTAFSLNVVEILREAGPKGLHVEEIQSKTNKPVKAATLARVLRHLATNHIFREVSPNVFANNRVSSCADTGKEPATLAKEGDVGRYQNVGGLGAGLAALLQHIVDDVFKSSTYLAENVINAADTTPFHQCFNTNLNFFDWLEEPNNEFRKLRFGKAMLGTQLLERPTAVLQGMDWNSLDEGSLVVDVGGGHGHVVATIAAGTERKLRFVVQDRAVTIGEAKEYWNAPERIQYYQNGNVKLQIHDFFESQPIKDANVFILRLILHDWPDENAQLILRQLRASAMPSTKLVLLERVPSFACVDTTEASKIEGFNPAPAPKPLLPNFGRASVTIYNTDMTMETLFHGKERTLSDFIAMVKSTGWKLTRVYRLPGSPFSQVIAEPA